MADFVRPTPYQMLTDYRIQCIMDGKEFNENAAINFVNDHHYANQWSHPDIPLAEKKHNPLIIPANPRRAALIKRDDAAAKEELAAAKAEAYAAQMKFDRETYETGTETERLRVELEEMTKQRDAAVRKATRATKNANVPEGFPDESWTTMQMREFAIKNEVGSALPSEQAQLSAMGKKNIIETIRVAMDRKTAAGGNDGNIDLPRPDEEPEDDTLDWVDDDESDGTPEV